MVLHQKTPLLCSYGFSKKLGRNVWLKFESSQPTGSFKNRGIGQLCVKHKESGIGRFVASSGGNAGLAVAYCGRQLSVPVTLVVSQSASQRAVEAARSEGAEVIVKGDSWLESHQYALSLLGKGDGYVPPFDDPAIWDGNSTIIDEVVEAGVKPTTVLFSVGGGGLMSGVDIGLSRHGLGETALVAVETYGADSFSKAFAAGKLVTLDRITSIAATLGAKTVSSNCLELVKRRKVNSVCVTDKQAVDACLSFADDWRVIVEPACGAALAVLYGNSDVLRGSGDLLVIVCGGVSTNFMDLVRYRDSLAP